MICQCVQILLDAADDLILKQMLAMLLMSVYCWLRVVVPDVTVVTPVGRLKDKSQKWRDN